MTPAWLEKRRSDIRCLWYGTDVNTCHEGRWDEELAYLALLEKIGEAMRSHRDSGECSDDDSCYLGMEYHEALEAYERGPA